MAIYKQVFTQSGENDAQIDAAHDWATAFRVRMTDADRFRHGACNTLRIVNTADEDITISITWDVGRTNSFLVRTGGIFNLTVEDGQSFYGFDVYDAHATTNVSAAEIKYTMSRVEQIGEGA